MPDQLRPGRGRAQRRLQELAIAFLDTFASVFNPSVPAWWPLIPGKGGIPLVSLRGNEDGGEIWERYEDEFAEILDEELPEDI